LLKTLSWKNHKISNSAFTQRATYGGQPLRERSAAVSGDERGQPLRAAVGRKVERIINAGSVHTARDVARYVARSATSRGRAELPKSRPGPVRFQ
jgi:hypothetical protein